MEILGIHHLLSFLLLLYVLLAFVKFLYRTWWMPFRIQHMLESQGIRGPPYKFFHGNKKEISRMREYTMSRPMHLSSNDLFPVVQPHIHSWISKYGKNFVYWDGAKAELVVTEPELIKEMLHDREKYFTVIEFDKYIKRIVGGGILQANGAKWTKLRRLSNQAFHAQSLRNMVPGMIKSVEMMLGRWRNFEGKEIDVAEEFRLSAAEVIARTAFGSSYEEGKVIFPMLRKLVVLSSKNEWKIRLPIISKFLKDGDDVESEMLEKRIRESMLEIIKKREKLKTGGIHNFGEDFLGSLLKAHHDTNENVKLSIEEILDECKTFYSAGHGTSAVFLSWTIFLLAIHTDWQERAREEVYELFGQQPPNLEGISRLKMMSMVLNESLRLYPPALHNRRKTKKGAKLGKLSLPANISVVYPTLAVHHDPKIWGENVLVFNPERFSEGVAAATKNNPTTFLPFSLGPRSCVGANFAIQEAKITISMILQHYSFILSPNYIHSPIQILTLRPQHGVQIMLHAL